MRPYASTFVVVILLISIGTSVSFPVKIIQRINNGVGYTMIDIVVCLGFKKKYTSRLMTNH